MVKNEKVKIEKYGLSRLYLLTMLLSFLGWAFETAVVYFSCGRITDRGFLTLPFCPIYGCSIVFVYLLLGTPDECRIKGGSSKQKKFLYACLCLFMPTAMEFLIGFLFDKTLHCRLWDYSYYKYNLFGYICLRNSIIWAVLLFVFMKWIFPKIKERIGKLPKGIAAILSVGLSLIVAFDFFFNLIRAIG